MLGEGPTDDISDSIGTAEYKYSLNFTKEEIKFCLSLNYNGDNIC